VQVPIRRPRVLIVFDMNEAGWVFAQQRHLKSHRVDIDRPFADGFDVASFLVQQRKNAVAVSLTESQFLRLPRAEESGSNLTDVGKLA